MNSSQKDTERRLKVFIQAARESGLKLTHQRLVIFRELAATAEHPDVETIYKRVRKRIPTVSLDTVYRTIAYLEKENAVTRVSLFSDRARYDSNTSPHHHFVCTECGLVRDFLSAELDGYQIPENVRTWGDVTTVYVELRGVCATCAQRRQEKPSA